LTELGYANAKGLWSALYAPAATPRDVLEIVRKAAVQALNSEQVATAFKQQMIRPLPSASIEEAQAWNKAEAADWKKVTAEVKVELQNGGAASAGVEGERTAMNMEPAPGVPVYGIVVEKDVGVPMRDGARLKADVFRPDDAGTFPAILNLGPYQ